MTKNELVLKALEQIKVTDGPGEIGEYFSDAMDEYAKLFGEKLIGWLNDNDFKPNGFKDNMQSDYVNNGERMHASEIVDLFIEQQNK